jgi:hypothetical protein
MMMTVTTTVVGLAVTPSGRMTPTVYVLLTDSPVTSIEAVVTESRLGLLRIACDPLTTTTIGLMLIEPIS